MKNSLSIIVPVYNAEESLVTLWQSLKPQLSREDQLILVNDGSNDRSAEIIDRLAAEDPRIKAIHKVNGGVSSARNAGIASAAGDYILFLDSDDTLLPYTLRDFKCLQAEHAADMYIFNLAYQVGDLYEDKYLSYQEGYLSQERAINDIFDNRKLAGFVWNKAYKRELLDTITFDEDIYMAEDLLFCLKAVLQAETFYFWDRPTHIYYNNPESLSHSFSAKKLTTFLVYERIGHLIDLKAYPYIHQVLSCAKVNFSRYLLEYYYKNLPETYARKHKQYKKVILENLFVFLKTKTSMQAKIATILVLISPKLTLLARGK